MLLKVEKPRQKAILFPLGDHAGWLLSEFDFVTWRTSRPSDPIVNTCRVPDLSLMKAIRLPLGDHDGLKLEPLRVSCRRPVPSGRMTKMSSSQRFGLLHER